jgi:hypothetical protein
MSTDSGASWRKIIASVGVLVVLSPVCRFASADNIVINGNFETPVAGRDFVMFQPGDTFGGWTVATTWVDLVGTSVQAAGGRPVCRPERWLGRPNLQDLATVPGRHMSCYSHWPKWAGAANAQDQANGGQMGDPALWTRFHSTPWVIPLITWVGHITRMTSQLYHPSRRAAVYESYQDCMGPDDR